MIPVFMMSWLSEECFEDDLENMAAGSLNSTLMIGGVYRINP
jgi:predicted Mrr-cat superfamily restriction endonuclease